MCRLLFLILFSVKCFGQVLTDSLPSFAIKYNPVPLFLEVDKHLQMSFEYFIDAKRSAQFTFGFGNRSMFKKENYNVVYMARIEYRKFSRPFSFKKNGRNYWATELMFKYAEEPFSPVTTPTDILGYTQPPYFTKFFVNVLASHLKIGREYVDMRYFPTFDIFLGLGVRAYHNYIGYTPPGYSRGFSGFMFDRGPGTGVFPSAVVGLGIGIGKWKRK